MMDKILMILASIFTALCWLSLCLDWDLTMYISGFVAIILIAVSDFKENTCKEKGKE